MYAPRGGRDGLYFKALNTILHFIFSLNKFYIPICGEIKKKKKDHLYFSISLCKECKDK